MGVLLRADLTGYGHPTLFGRKGLDSHAMFGQPSKGHLYRILFFFHNALLHITTYQKFGDLFCPVHISGLQHSVQVQLAVELYLTQAKVMITHIKLLDSKKSTVSQKTDTWKDVEVQQCIVQEIQAEYEKKVHSKDSHQNSD